MHKRKKDSKLKPLKKFRVYLDRIYYLVYMWETLREMRDHRVKRGISRSKGQACTLMYEQRYGRQIGEIHFTLYGFVKGSPSYLISHEATHAAFGFLRMAKTDFNKLNDGYDIQKKTGMRNNPMEEIVAEIVSTITHQITERLKLENKQR